MPGSQGTLSPTAGSNTLFDFSEIAAYVHYERTGMPFSCVLVIAGLAGHNSGSIDEFMGRQCAKTQGWQHDRRADLRGKGSVLKVGRSHMLELTQGLEGLLELLIKLHRAVHPERPILELHDSTAAPHINPKPSKRALCCVYVLASRLEHLSCTAWSSGGTSCGNISFTVLLLKVCK